MYHIRPSHYPDSMNQEPSLVTASGTSAGVRTIFANCSTLHQGKLGISNAMFCDLQVHAVAMVGGTYQCKPCCCHRGQMEAGHWDGDSCRWWTEEPFGALENRGKCMWPSPYEGAAPKPCGSVGDIPERINLDGALAPKFSVAHVSLAIIATRGDPPHCQNQKLVTLENCGQQVKRH